MKTKENFRVSLFDMVMCLSSAMDLVDEAVTNHHMRVAYIATSLAHTLGLDRAKQSAIFTASALHDVGAFTLHERLDALNFEIGSPSHAELGYLLIKGFRPFSYAARIIRHHHSPWDNGKGTRVKGVAVLPESHILELADRIDVLIDKKSPILGQIEHIKHRITRETGRLFVPEHVEAFLTLSKKEFFWLEIITLTNRTLLPWRDELASITMGLDEVLDLAELIGEIIDYRCEFTATHSKGVGSVASELARCMGMNEHQCTVILAAGYLHDLGKLAVPAEIIAKNGPLTSEEFDIVKAHPYYTYTVLRDIADFEEIGQFASFHHEHSDGSGYPFHHTAKDLPLGSRIIAVADVFTAISEDRPYRLGLNREDAQKLIARMTGGNDLDPEVVRALNENWDKIDKKRIEAQKKAMKKHKSFQSKTPKVTA